MGFINRSPTAAFARALAGVLFAVISSMQAWAAPVRAAATIDVRISPVANYIYQLDCISGAAQTCGGRADYVDLWQARFGVDAARASDIAQWSSISRLHDGAYATRIRIASLTASSLADYLRRIDVLLPKTEAHAVHAIATAHYARFEKWWREDPGHARATRVRQLARTLSGALIAAELPRLRRLFAVPQGSATHLTLSLLYRPSAAIPKVTTGQNLSDDWAVTEFTAHEGIGSRVGVVLHEYTHYLFGMLPHDQLTALRARIVQSGANGAGAWKLFNEAMASAIGNGRVYREFSTPAGWQTYLARPESFYNVESIDVAAKAILPVLDAALNDGRSITDPGFSRRYVEALNGHMGDLWQSPSMVLTEFKTVIDAKVDREVIDFAIRTLRANSVWYDWFPCCDADFNKNWDANAGYTRVAILLKANVAASPQLDPGVAKSVAVLPEGVGATVITHSGTLPNVVLVGDTIASMEAAITQLAAMRTVSDGLYRTDQPSKPAPPGIEGTSG